jgi:transcriptional regulator with XRE-family HTH domain
MSARQPMTVSMTVGERIRARRKELGLSQTRLAKLVGVSRGSVQQWESGKIEQIRPDKIPKLAAVLDIDMSLLTLFGAGGVTPLDKKQKTRAVRLIEWDDLRQLVRGKMKPSALKTKRYIEVDLEISAECFALRIADHSMADEFAPPDVIILNPTLTPEQDDFVLVRINKTGEEVFRRYVQRRGGAYDLVPEDGKWPTVTINDSNPGELLGVLEEHRKKRRKKSRS